MYLFFCFVFFCTFMFQCSEVLTRRWPSVVGIAPYSRWRKDATPNPESVSGGRRCWTAEGKRRSEPTDGARRYCLPAKTIAEKCNDP